MPEKLSEDMQEAARFAMSGEGEKGCARLTPGVLVAIVVLIGLMFIGAAWVYSLVQDKDGDLAQLTAEEQRCVDFANAGNNLHSLPDCPGLIASLAFPTREQCEQWVTRNGMTREELPHCAQHLPTPAAATATPAPAQATATAPPAGSSRIAPATEVEASTDDAENIYVEWQYKEEWEVPPDYFEVLFDGQVVNTDYNYEGLDWEYGYSWGGPVGCGVTHQIVVRAINGSEYADAPPVEGKTNPC